MSDSSETKGRLAVIPARGGSKRLPGKNVRPIAGRPMILWVIDAALSAGLFDKVLVSTDDQEIADISRSAGADVPGLRPAKLAQDDTPTIDVVTYELERLPEIPVTVLLQPTSPLVLAEDITGAIALLETQGVDSVASVAVSQVTPNTLFDRREESGVLTPFVEQCTASLGPSKANWVRLNGAIYAFRSSWLRNTHNLVDNTTVGYVMPLERSVDVDVEIDLIFAESLLKMRESSS